MSFFGIKHARRVAKSPRNSPAALGPVNKLNAATLHRLGCQACTLANCGAHTPYMKPTLGGGPVYFLAEAPGRNEDEQSGCPLTGPSGKLLRSLLPDDDNDFNFDNVVNCRPPENRDPTSAEIESCRPRRIKFIEKAKPKLIVGLGAISMSAILGSSDMQNLRGRLIAVQVGSHRCWFMGTYHPSFILRIAKYKDKPLNSMMGHCFRMDIAKALEVADHLSPPQIHGEADARKDIEVFDGSDGYDRLIDLLRRAKAAKIKAVDLETRFLRPYTAGAGIMSAAISFDPNVNFSFAIDHPQCAFTEAQKQRILVEFGELLADDTTKIAHNTPFELEWLAWQYGPEIINHTAWECTMMQAHFLDERKGDKWDDTARASKFHGLDFLIWQYFGLHLKSLFKINKKDTSKTPLSDLLPYNAIDTKYTLKLWHLQKKALGTNGDRAAYRGALLQQPTVALMQHLGVHVDQAAVKQAQKQLGQEVAALEFNIQNLNVVKQFVADNKEFNPGSQDQVLRVFRDYLKRPEVVVTPTTGSMNDYDKAPRTKRKFDQVDKPRYSVDKAVLDKIDHPLAKLMINWRNRTKLKSTYVDGVSLEALAAGKPCVIFPDGQLHTNFNTTTTETGRLSSDEPNLQNYPKRNDAWVRRLVIPPPGHLMVAIDFGQLEACTGAMCSKDTYLCKALWEDYDIHMDWTTFMAKKKPALVGGSKGFADKAVMKRLRSLVKNKMVFPAFYGASSKSIAGYMTVATGVDVDESFIDDVLDEFWSVLSGMKRWQDRLMQGYYDTGYVTTLGGRKHRYPLTRNQAINFPFQGTAAELVGDAMSRLSYMAAQTGKWHLHPILNIHDDLTFFIPDKDSVLDESLHTIMREMMIFDFPWVNVPLSLEISIGPNWADLQPLGKFWSHKEFGYPNK